MFTAIASKVIPVLTNMFSNANYRYKFNLMRDGGQSNKTDYQCDTEIQTFASQLAQQTSRCVLFIRKIIEFCEDTFVYAMA